jgi:hypothetical protein
VHRRPARRLAPFVALLIGVAAYAADSNRLGVAFPDWILVAEGDARAAVVEIARPLAREHAFRCTVPEVFLLPDAPSIEAALRAYVRHLPERTGEQVVGESDGVRVAVIGGPALMFERLSVFVVAEGGVWLVVC